MPTIVGRGFLAFILVLIASTVSAQTTGGSFDPKTVEEWRKGRMERLLGPTGWISLAGLYWLDEGDNTFGKARDNVLVLEHAAMPARLGIFRLKDRRVTFVAAPSSKVTHDSKPIQSIVMTPDAENEPPILEVGTLQFFAIERAGKFGVRVRDTDHPARRNFRGIEHFPVSAAWSVQARFVPYAPVRHIPIVNILGMTEQMVSPGAIVFAKEGKEYRLDAVLENPGDKELFIMFADLTSARESYGAGRYVYIPMPVGDKASIDFNRAYNPPCAFTDFATCPLPPLQNRLQLRVEAGEKKYPANK